MTRLPVGRLAGVGLAALLVAAACGRRSATTPRAADAGPATRLGTVEVTARLAEVPEGAIFRRDLYDYATILKYTVTAVQRGALHAGDVIYVAHYNPWKPRSEAADKRAPGIGGTVRQFRAGACHHRALAWPLDDAYMGGVVDKYFGVRTGQAYWAVWADDAD